MCYKINMHKINTLLLIFSLNITSADLFLTDEYIHSTISDAMNELLPNQELSISTNAVEGSRDNFQIKKLRVSSPFFGELLKIKEFTCSGYKINDYEFNMYFEKYFKLPNLEDVEIAINTPSKCSIKGLSIPFLESMTSISPELSKYSLLTSLFTNINIDIASSHMNGEFKQNLNMNLAERIYITNDYKFSGDTKAMYQFFDTFIENIVSKYWGYKNYNELYADTSGDTSEIYLDFMADISSNPFNYFENLPSTFPQLLLKKSTSKIMWSEKEFESLTNNFPEIEDFLLELKRSVRTKLSQDEFKKEFKMLTDESMQDSLDFDSLYNFYSTGIEALQEFAVAPRGLEMTISSDEGINLIPEKQMLSDFLQDESNNEVEISALPYILVISSLGSSFKSMNISLKANPKIE